MDVFCQVCGEPWDSYGLHIDTVDCDCCDGSGTVELRESRVSEAHDDGYTSLAVIGYDECSGITYEDCACQDEDNWHECLWCYSFSQSPDYPYWRDGRPESGWIPVPHIIVTEGTWYEKRGGWEVCLHPQCKDGRIPEHTHGEEKCNSDQQYHSMPSCDGCGEEIEARSYFDVNGVITDGGYYCLSCARTEGIVEDEEPCKDCTGTGKVERGRDAMEPQEIRDFTAGKGCPSCDFGIGRECHPCKGEGSLPDISTGWFTLEYGTADYRARCMHTWKNGQACPYSPWYARALDSGAYEYSCPQHARVNSLLSVPCADCHGTGREPTKGSATAEASRLIFSMCEHMDDVAVMSEDLISTGIADSLLGGNNE